MNDLPTNLRELVTMLTSEHDTAVYWHNELVRYRPDPPLLSALRDARTGNIGNAAGGSGAAAHERTTLNIAASELFGAIENRVKAWARAADVPREWATDWTDPIALLRAWHTRTLGDIHFDDRPYANTLRGWAAQISDLILDPPRRWVIATACPLCNARWVIEAEGIGMIGIDSNGTRLNYPWAITYGQQVDALAVTERDPVHESTVVCRHCEAVWRGIEGTDGARQLAIAIDDASNAA